jgi:hypothetical protein
MTCFVPFAVPFVQIVEVFVAAKRVGEGPPDP